MSDDYFSNHALKLRFPWRLYHAPIVEELAEQLRSRQHARVLNIGAGPFLELDALPSRGHSFTLCDIDPRAMEAARQMHGARLSSADVVEVGAPLPYEDERFEVVAAMDVVEHVVPPEPWLAEAFRVLAPGGSLFLTTPNYGSRSLRALEATVLELIARIQGFSRRDIHPTKLDHSSLAKLLRALPGGRVSVRTISRGWVLAATVEKGPP